MSPSLLCVTLLASTAAAAPGPGTTLTDPAAFADQWLVILGTFTDDTSMPESMKVLERYPELLAPVARTTTTELKGLMPCYQIVVAGRFRKKSEARALWQRLRSLGVDAYFKQAGAHVGRRPQVEAYCRTHGRRAGPCGAIHWIERWGERTFMKLTADDALVQRAAAGLAAPKPIDDRWEAWAAPLPNRVLGDYRVGARFHALGGNDAEPEPCTLRRFVMLSRGTPHFAWYPANREADVEPTAPGCGSPELFAELSCDLHGPHVAVPEGAPLPRLLVPAGAAAERDTVLAAVKRGSSYASARQRALAAAKERNAAREDEVVIDLFARADGLVAIVTVVLFTGEGVIECGHDDVRTTLRGAVALADPGTVSGVLAPLQEIEGSSIEGLLEVGGQLRLLERLFPNRTRLAPLGGGDACEISYEYCDCPC